MHEDAPQAAWLILPATQGRERDAAALHALFTEGLHPDRRPELHYVADENELVTADAVYQALTGPVAQAKCPRWVWLVSHVEPRFGDHYLATHWRPDLTLTNLWKQLIAAANADRSWPLVAVVDACFSKPPDELVTRLPPNLIAFAACDITETARSTSEEGSWLTQTLCRRLIHGDGEVLAGDLNTWLQRHRKPNQNPFAHTSGRFAATVLNVRRPPATPADDPLSRYRAWVADTHGQLVDFFDKRLIHEVFVQVELAHHEGAADHEPVRFLGDLMKRAGGRFSVLGEPGAGKSTLARHLASQTARDPDGPLPIYVQLADFAARPHTTVFKYAAAVIEEAGGDAGGIEAALKAAAADGRAWFLLDGLDEVHGDHIRRARGRISDTDWGKCPVAVFSRPAGFSDFNGFERVTVRSLDPDGQRELLGKWLPDPEPAWQQIQGSPALRELAGTPLLLALMALVWVEARALRPSRAALYEDALTQLILRAHACDTEATALPSDALPAIRQTLRHLSFELQRGGGEFWGPEALAETLDRLAHEDPDAVHGRGAPEVVRAALRATGGTAGSFLQRIGAVSGVLAPHDGPDKPWRYLHRSLRDALSAELLGKVDDATFVAAAKQLRRAAGRWAETFAQAANHRGNPADTVALLRKAAPELALRVALEADGLAPADALRLVLDTEGWTPEHLRRLVERAPDDPALTAELMAWVTPDADLERLAEAHYALSAGDLDHDSFFAKAGKGAPPPLVWTKLPGGVFEMGSPEGVGHSNEQPRPWVELNAFSMTPTVVTRAQLAALDPRHECPGGDKHPATGVSWYVARLFARWHGAELPTEAEWEYACRAETTSRWSFGDDPADLDAHGWFNENSKREAHPVGLKAHNPWGLYDLHGNVWEWCHDWYGAYIGGAHTDPTGPENGAERVWRGGSAWDDADVCRSAFRFWNLPRSRDRSLGFRLVRPAPHLGPRS